MFLHDLGKVVMEQHVKEAFDEVARLVEERNMLFYQAEEEVLEMTFDDETEQVDPPEQGS